MTLRPGFAHIVPRKPSGHSAVRSFRYLAAWDEQQPTMLAKFPIPML